MRALRETDLFLDPMSSSRYDHLKIIPSPYLDGIRCVRLGLGIEPNGKPRIFCFGEILFKSFTVYRF